MIENLDIRYIWKDFVCSAATPKAKDMKIKGKILPNLKNLYFLKKSPPAWDQKSADHH